MISDCKFVMLINLNVHDFNLHFWVMCSLAGVMNLLTDGSVNHNRL